MSAQNKQRRSPLGQQLQLKSYALPRTMSNILQRAGAQQAHSGEYGGLNRLEVQPLKHLCGINPAEKTGTLNVLYRRVFYAAIEGGELHPVPASQFG
jgi:hypothetical protein